MARTAHSPSSSGGTSHNSRPLCRNVDESQSCAKSPTAVTTSWPAAGITAGSWYASPATHLGYELIGLGCS